MLNSGNALQPGEPQGFTYLAVRETTEVPPKAITYDLVFGSSTNATIKMVPVLDGGL